MNPVDDGIEFLPVGFFLWVVSLVAGAVAMVIKVDGIVVGISFNEVRHKIGFTVIF